MHIDSAAIWPDTAARKLTKKELPYVRGGARPWGSGHQGTPDTRPGEAGWSPVTRVATRQLNIKSSRRFIESMKRIQFYSIRTDVQNDPRLDVTWH